jgi:hypothetical protein
MSCNFSRIHDPVSQCCSYVDTKTTAATAVGCAQLVLQCEVCKTPCGARHPVQCAVWRQAMQAPHHCLRALGWTWACAAGEGC